MEKKRKEKRKHKRLSTQVILDIVTLKEPKRTARAVISDISKGGAKFISEEEFSQEESIELIFRLPDTTFKFIGVIVRFENNTTSFGYGVEFIKMKFKDRFALKKLISRIRVE